MGDMRDELCNYHEAKAEILATCGCGQKKSNKGHLACSDCMAKVPPGLLAEFFDLSRHKRGSCSWHVTRREVIAELEKIQKAGMTT